MPPPNSKSSTVRPTSVPTASLHRRPATFSLKKWTVIAINAFYVLVLVYLLVSLAFIVYGAIVSRIHKHDYDDKDGLFQLTLSFLVGTFIMFMHLLGLLGAWYEHFWLSVVYATFETILLIVCIVFTVFEWKLFPIVVLILFPLVPSILMLIDLWRTRDTHQQNTLPMVTITPRYA